SPGSRVKTKRWHGALYLAKRIKRKSRRVAAYLSVLGRVKRIKPKKAVLTSDKVCGLLQWMIRTIGEYHNWRETTPGQTASSKGCAVASNVGHRFGGDSSAGSLDGRILVRVSRVAYYVSVHQTPSGWRHRR